MPARLPSHGRKGQSSRGRRGFQEGQHDGLKYASIKDQRRGRTIYIIDKTDGVYRVRYFHTVERATYVIAKGRSLQKVLSETPEWPVTPTRKPSLRRPK